MTKQYGEVLRLWTSRSSTREVAAKAGVNRSAVLATLHGKRKKARPSPFSEDVSFDMVRERALAALAVKLLCKRELARRGVRDLEFRQPQAIIASQLGVEEMRRIETIDTGARYAYESTEEQFIAVARRRRRASVSR
jgi:hypothetical protein